MMDLFLCGLVFCCLLVGWFSPAGKMMGNNVPLALKERHLKALKSVVEGNDAEELHLILKNPRLTEDSVLLSNGSGIYGPAVCKGQRGLLWPLEEEVITGISLLLYID